MTLMDVRPGLRAWLIADNAISTLVSSRIYPVQLPQGITQTSIVYHRISEIEGYNYGGPIGLIATRFQIDAYSQSIDDAATLADAIKERIGGFAGAMTFGPDSPPQDYVNVQGIFFSNGREDFDNESKFYRVSRDYIIWYEDRQ